MKFPQLKLKLRAFGHRNYRLFFFGQGTSLIGTWMNNVAAIWEVYHLTDSPLLLGVFGFLSQSPAILAHFIGAPSTMLIEGICCGIGAMVFWRYLPIVRRSLKGSQT